MMNRNVWNISVRSRFKRLYRYLRLLELFLDVSSATQIMRLPFNAKSSKVKGTLGSSYGYG